jgi:glycosyltransferase involved in cell wall biosynthesis
LTLNCILDSMMDKHLHIVAHDVPLPSDSGILKELAFLTKALHAQGILLHLHCFGKEKPLSLEPFCHELHLYPKKQGHKGYTIALPYSVSSRSDKSLVRKLEEDKFPILFAGLKTVSPLLDTSLSKKRKIVVRMLRNEQRHFQDLSRLCPWGSQKLFYAIESFRFGQLMKQLSTGLIQFAVSPEYNAIKQSNLDGYTLVDQMIEMPFLMPRAGTGNFCLYHGNLSKTEHDYAAHWLLKNVFNSLEVPFVIAGDNPSEQLEQAAHEKMHTCLVSNPSEKELQDLIKKAQVNLLPSFVGQCNTGLLYQSLAMGRHLLTNSKGVCEMGTASTCHVAEGSTEFIHMTEALFDQPFDAAAHEARASFLNGKYNNQNSVDTLIKMLY